jgi:hypothetical protein
MERLTAMMADLQLRKTLWQQLRQPMASSVKDRLKLTGPTKGDMVIPALQAEDQGAGLA